MVALILAARVQVVVNRRNLTAIGMSGLPGLSVVFGAGGFVLTVIIPTLPGQGVRREQSTAFLFFLVYYVVMVVECAVFGPGVAVLMLLDAALIYGSSVERAPALGISLAVLGAAYLPLRRRAEPWIGRNGVLPAGEHYRCVTDVCLMREGARKQQALAKLWNELFSPLSIKVLPEHCGNEAVLGKEAVSGENSSALVVAPVFGLPALRLERAKKGTRLFPSKYLLHARSVRASLRRGLR